MEGRGKKHDWTQEEAKVLYSPTPQEAPEIQLPFIVILSRGKVLGLSALT